MNDSTDDDAVAPMGDSSPEALKRAALRRVWTADPAIRDFVELNENFWDAAGPEGIPGFGDLDPNFDVQRMVAQLFGEAPDKDDAPGLPAGEPENAALPKADELSPNSRLPAAEVTPSIEGNLSQCNENAATQQTSPESGTVKKIARRHGSAMPE